jgi:hypothetical protein
MNANSNPDKLNTVMVSTKEPEKNTMEKLKSWAQKNSDNRKESLTRLSNKANQMLSKTVGQTLRSARNVLSDNKLATVVLGDNTFTTLLPDDKDQLKEISKGLNDIMLNIDFAEDKDGKQAEEDVKSLLINNKDIYTVLENILEQPKIRQHIANKIGKGKRMPEILQHMFREILSHSGANPQVSDLVSNILTYKMDYGSEGYEEKQDDTVDPNEITLDVDLNDNDNQKKNTPIIRDPPVTKQPASPVTKQPVTKQPVTVPTEIDN